MIFYVVTDSPANYRQPAQWHQTQCVLERLSRDVCLTLSYQHLSRPLLQKHRPWAIVHSGASAFVSEYDILKSRPYRQLIRSYDAAQIGLCGGHQLISMMFGCTCDYMRRLRDGEPDLSSYSPGYLKEWGIYPVQIVRRDPLFAGFQPTTTSPTTIHVQEYHCWEVKTLTPELLLLASSSDCRVQAFRHVRRPIYGTQFHPEYSTDRYPDGFRVLSNFFRIARHHWRANGKA
jgi:GMP synthase (glutamine-hydrolysing)